jgi:hypothetical protein
MMIMPAGPVLRRTDNHVLVINSNQNVYSFDDYIPFEVIFYTAQ